MSDKRIVSQLKVAEIRKWLDPVKLRLAYEWLMIEKEMKGQRWYLKKYHDRGKVRVEPEKGKFYWVFESEIFVTSEFKQPTNPIFEKIWVTLHSQNPPYYVKVLNGDKSDSIGVGVPSIIRRIWEEIYKRVDLNA